MRSSGTSGGSGAARHHRRRERGRAPAPSRSPIRPDRRTNRTRGARATPRPPAAGRARRTAARPSRVHRAQPEPGDVLDPLQGQRDVELVGTHVVRLHRGLVGGAHQQAVPLVLEVEAVGGVDDHRQPAPVRPAQPGRIGHPDQRDRAPVRRQPDPRDPREPGDDVGPRAGRVHDVGGVDGLRAQLHPPAVTLPPHPGDRGTGADRPAPAAQPADVGLVQRLGVDVGRVLHHGGGAHRARPQHRAAAVCLGRVDRDRRSRLPGLLGELGGQRRLAVGVERDVQQPARCEQRWCVQLGLEPGEPGAARDDQRAHGATP